MIALYYDFDKKCKKIFEVDTMDFSTLATHIGKRTLVFYQEEKNLLKFIGTMVLRWIFAPHGQKRCPKNSFLTFIEDVGVQAISIVSLLSFLIGMVLCYQSLQELRRYGAELFTIDFLAIALFREISVLITAIIVAGRSGSAFTAQLGAMFLNQEVDALRSYGLDPYLMLVSPRILALIVALPLLVFISVLSGLFGGMLLCLVSLELPPIQFLNHLQHNVDIKHLFIGLSKAPLFAFIIGIISCFKGFQVQGSAQSIGQKTTESVVESIFFVIVFDAFLSVLFSSVGL